jgi:hypothetical protein
MADTSAKDQPLVPDEHEQVPLNITAEDPTKDQPNLKVYDSQYELLF